MERMRLYAQLSAAGLVLVCSVLVGLWAGQWLDGAAGTEGILTVLLMAVGMLGGVLNLLRSLTRAGRTGGRERDDA